jgi:HK97 family phage prohead protease
MEKFDFGGWATRNNLKCSDGRTILKDAFKHNDGQTVPLVWNHQHNDPFNVLGHALLENREEGVYAYCTFNDTEAGKTAKEYVQHGDVTALSIYANKLKQQGANVLHGAIREVSLVLAGANPGAYIDAVMCHGEESEEEAVIYTGEDIVLAHAEDEKQEKEDTAVAEETKKTEKTVEEVYNEMTEEQQAVVHVMVGMALEDQGDDAEHSDIDENEDSEGGNETMKHNVFDQEEVKQGNVLSHSDQEAIIKMAKQSNVGSLKNAIKLYAEENDMLSHAEGEGDGVGIFEDYGVLFPELELLKKGEPDTIYKNDQSWVAPALAKIHKSPFSRIRTRHADARLAELKAKGYQKKGDEKTVMGQIKMIGRETTPQTIYIKDSLHRDDIVDITDFSIVDYQWKQMRTVLNETMVLAAMVGDGRELGDPDKISEEHVRPIWKDDEEYTIHHDVDIAAAKAELQGSNTGANFGENYIYAEAIITAALYSREKFKGTGTPDFYCTPHLVNVMLLARDLNGRRIYDSKADLAKALNCNTIVEVEQFEGLTRTTEGNKTKKLLGLFVNLNDYTFGSTRGGEITKFEDFDMDFNLQKFMLETRLSGSLYKLKSAIALEEPVVDAAG